MKKNDGGPAFPRSKKDAVGNDGMSLREYYAGQALSGIMANPERWKEIANDYYNSGKKNAAKAVSLADALIEELEKTK